MWSYDVLKIHCLQRRRLKNMKPAGSAILRSQTKSAVGISMPNSEPDKLCIAISYSQPQRQPQLLP